VAFVIYDFTAFVIHDRTSRSISIRFLSIHIRQGNRKRQVYADVSSVYIACLMFASKYVIMFRLLQCVVPLNAYDHLGTIKVRCRDQSRVCTRESLAALDES